MSGFQILVESVSLGDELLLPLSESLFLDLDLLGESLPQRFFLFLELGVVQLPRTSLAEFPSLHLLRTVGLVVLFFGGVNEIQHVGTDQDRTELLEIAVILVLDFGNTPGILTTLDNTVVTGLDVLLGSDHGERHGSHQAAGMGGGVFVVLLDGRGVNLDALGFNDGLHLRRKNALLVLAI